MKKTKWKSVKMDGKKYLYTERNAEVYLVKEPVTGHTFIQDKKDIDLIVALRTIRRLCWFMIAGGGIGIILRFLEIGGVI